MCCISSYVLNWRCRIAKLPASFILSATEYFKPLCRPLLIVLTECPITVESLSKFVQNMIFLLLLFFLKKGKEPQM